MLKLKTPSIVIHWFLLRTGPDFRQSLGNPPERSTERTANSVLTKNFLLPWPQNNSYTLVSLKYITRDLVSSANGTILPNTQVPVLQ